MATAGMVREPLDGKLRLTVRVTPENMRRDLDIELLCDALQTAGLIVNDRLIWEKHVYRETPDKLNPHVWFCVERMD